MTSLELVVESANETQATIHFEGEVNPRDRTPGRNVGSEKTYPLTFRAEIPREFRLVENPADRFPRAVQQLLDAAQQTVWENNKPSGTIGDKSTQFSAIAETVAGQSLTQTGGRPAMHIGKNAQYRVGLDRYINNPLIPARAKEILQAERAKAMQAEEWCSSYRTGNAKPLPAWAEPYRRELVKYGLPSDYPSEPPPRRVRR